MTNLDAFVSKLSRRDAGATHERDSFRIHMPAEWEPHAATWLAWPHNRNDWPGKFEPIPWVYAEIIRYLARHERVEVIVNDAIGGEKGPQDS